MRILDIDGDDSVDPLSDGILLIRYFLGMRGSGLISGAISGGAIRTTAAEIEGYISGMRGYFDIDGDGKTDIADAVLILRFLFDLTGDVMVDGLISAGARRSTDAAVTEYLDILESDI